jgi:N-terminal half of MaoC dehydratase
MMDEDWKQAWQPVVAAVGRDFGEGRLMTGADEVSAATIRRYLEPLEFDCALHYDTEVARAHGYADVIAPNTSIQTFSLPPMWQPGENIFKRAERNAQPEPSSLAGFRAPMEPPTTGYFATDYAVEYLLPVTVGDRLHRRGAKLAECLPRETKMGRGAFLTWESEICNQRNEVVARTRTTWLRYNPREEEPQ